MYKPKRLLVNTCSLNDKCNVSVGRWTRYWKCWTCRGMGSEQREFQPSSIPCRSTPHWRFSTWRKLTSSSPLPIPVNICTMTLVQNKITTRCAKSVYHSGEHLGTYTKTLCLFHCTKTIYHNGDQNLTLKPHVFFTVPRAFITMGTKTLH